MDNLPPVAYQYDNLPAAGHIRLLHLQPGSNDDPLRCTLETTLISDANYEAVSYVWGSGVKDHSITCDGKVIPITANLYTALRHLRSDISRTLWADSICIDQDNHTEKGLQVAMMGQIYRSAVRVLLVIGDNDLDMGQAVHSLVSEISTMVRETLQECGYAPDSFPWPEVDSPIVKDPRWPSFNLFLSQDWFSRGWVVQEAALAKEARLILGETETDWTDFMLTCIWQMLRFPVRQDWIDRVSLHCSLYTYSNPRVLRAFRPGQIKESHLSILASSDGLQFSDQRDRVFAFGEVAKDLPGYVPVQPDYDVSYLTIYKQFATDYIRQNKSVEVLEYAGQTAMSLEDAAPSWVPRWYAIPSQKKMRERHAMVCQIFQQPTIANVVPRLFRDVIIPSPGYSRVLFPTPLLSREDIAHVPSMDSENHLRVRGVLVGTVAYASRLTWYHGKDIIDLTINLLQHIQDLETKTAYPQEKLLDVLLSNFTSGVYFGPQATFDRDRAALALHILATMGCTDEEELARRRKGVIGGDLRAMVKRISVVIPRMTFILTSRGHMGLVPDVVREGDECAIVFGMNRLSMLRRAGDGDLYRYLGVGTVMGKAYYGNVEEGKDFLVLGDKGYKEWDKWDVEEQDIVLC